MSHHLVRFLSPVALLVTCGLAQAADLPRRAPALLAPVPVATWDGFYAGSFVGIGSGTFTSSQTGSASQSSFARNVGMLAGYNFQNGAVVYGVEGDLAMNVMRKGLSGSGLVTHAGELLDSGHLRGRLGYDLGVLMPYVAAGGTYAQSAVRVGEKGAVKTSYGFNLGAGVDWRVSLPIFGMSVLRAEYVYDRLPSSNYTYDSSLAAIRMRADSHLLRAAFIYTPDQRGWRAPQMDAADWAGAYAGVIGAYARNEAKTQTASASQSLTADGGLGGLYAGRNFVFGRWVAGFDSSTMLGSVKGSGTVPGTTDAMSYRNYFESTLRGRAGYAFGRFLPFLAAGVSTGRSEQTDTTTLAKRTRAATSSWNLGAGLDYMLTDRISTRVEYLHAKSFKDAQLDLNGTSMRQSRSADLVRAGIAYHFH